MFEDKNSNQQSQGDPFAAGQSSVAAAPPANLPTGSASRHEPEDILSAVDQSEIAVQRPATEQPLRETPPPSMPPVAKSEVAEPVFKRDQKIIVLVVVVVLAGAGVAFGGWYAYNQFGLGQKAPAVNTSQANVNQNTNQPASNQNVNQPGGQVNQNFNVSPPQPPAPPVDTDRDGLTDEEERLYGTSPNSPDTDGDGLTDRDEVKVFKTDPYLPDSDYDGFTDGEEVRNGYDPKGPGRLLQIPQ